MNFVRKLFCGVLALSTLAISANPSKEYKRDIRIAFEKVAQALEGETAFFEQVSKDKFLWFYMNSTSEKRRIGDKIIESIKRDLTPEQRDAVIDLLKEFKNLARFTDEDLLEMGRVCLEEGEIMEAVFKKKVAPLEKECSSKNQCKELAQVDLGNRSYNSLLQFLCQLRAMDYTDKAIRSMELDAGNESVKGLQKIFTHMYKEAACVSVVFIDHYFYRGWSNECMKVGKELHIMNEVCTYLLEGITS